MVYSTMLNGRFGRLLVFKGPLKQSGHYYYICACDCGNLKVVAANSLKSGRSKSCGCLRSEVSSKQMGKPQGHGHYINGKGTPTYYSWLSMKARCNNPQTNGYERYGGRGITYCREWEIFDNFLTDMGVRPQGCTLDRKDNNGNYTLSNCRWANGSTQRLNRGYDPAG